jgi:hypothetical protein
MFAFLKKSFKMPKGVIRIHKSKDVQHNGKKGQKDKQWFTKHTHKTKDRVVHRPPIHDMLTPLPMVFWPPAYLLIRNEGVNIPYDTIPFFIHDLSPDL